jgi:hypothetical protein
MHEGTIIPFGVERLGKEMTGKKERKRGDSRLEGNFTQRVSRRRKNCKSELPSRRPSGRCMYLFAHLESIGFCANSLSVSEE